MSTRSARTDLHNALAYAREQALSPAPLFTLETLKALPQTERAAAWHTADRPTKVAIACAVLTERGAFYDIADVDRWIDRQDGLARMELFNHEASASDSDESAPAAYIAPETSKTSSNTSKLSNTSSTSSKETTSMPTTNLDPSLVQIIRIALVTQHASPQFTRALDKAIGQIEAGAVARFDPIAHTLALASHSEPGVMRTTDGADCDCPGGRHAHCWHRACWALIVTLESVRDPFGLLRPALPVELEDDGSFPLNLAA